MKLLKAPCYLIMGILFSIPTFSQQISNVQATLQGDNIVVTYDLTAENPDDRFTISLYSSHNNFASPVNLVSGDVGVGITAGNGKRITWQARQELSSFTGNITFEVRGSLIAGQPQVTEPGQLTITQPQAGDAFKIGKSMGIFWRGGLDENVKMELYQDNMLKQPITTSPIPNSGSYTWPVPKDKSLKGDNYAIKLFNVNQPQSAVMSGEFRIKNKTSVLIYILPAVAVGAIVPFLLPKKSSEDACAVDPCSSPLCPNYSEALCNPLPAPPAVPSGN